MQVEHLFCICWWCQCNLVETLKQKPEDKNSSKFCLLFIFFLSSVGIVHQNTEVDELRQGKVLPGDDNQIFLPSSFFLLLYCFNPISQKQNPDADKSKGPSS